MGVGEKAKRRESALEVTAGTKRAATLGARQRAPGPQAGGTRESGRTMGV